MADEKWTIAQAIREIAPPELLQDLAAAREAASKTRRPTVRGYLRLEGGATVLRLSNQHVEYERLKKRLIEAKHRVEESLMSLLMSGRLVANGRYEKPIADLAPIPSSSWLEFRFADWESSKAVQNRTKIVIFEVLISRAVATDEKAPWTSAMQSAAADQGKAVQRVVTKVNELKPCRDWLVDYMRANRGGRIATWRKWFRRAKERWPGMSEVQFRKIWADAIVEAEAPKWAAAGPPRKTDIREVPEWTQGDRAETVSR